MIPVRCAPKLRPPMSGDRFQEQISREKKTAGRLKGAAHSDFSRLSASGGRPATIAVLDWNNPKAAAAHDVAEISSASQCAFMSPVWE